MTLTKKQHVELYTYLRQTRALEDWIFYICANQNPKDPLIIGKGYLSTGQEAVSVGAAYCLKENDWMAQSHRDFGGLLVKGLTVEDLLKQYFSKADSLTKGRDANVHFGCTEKKVLGFISHMGTLTAAANGVAWAAKYNNDDAVTLAFFGDGASSQGIVHEALNYAAVYKLAVVFICNNNGWAISTPLTEQFAIENIADRASGYGMPGSICDGNNVLDVFKHVKTAVDRAREGYGPSLVECKTMRMAGHGTHDRTKFRDEKELEFWKAKDPILFMEKYLIENKMATSSELKKIAKDCEQKVKDVTEKIRNLPGPKPDGQEDEVFSK